MAIQKDKLVNSILVGNYWKVTQTIVDKINMKANYSMALYPNKDVAVAGAPIGCGKSFSFDITDQDLAGDIVALGYDKIKNLKDPDLDGGLDV